MAKPSSKTPSAKKSQQTKHKADATKDNASKGLKPAEQKVLDLVARLQTLGKQEVSRQQVFNMASIGKSTFANALTTLKAGYLEVEHKTLAITDLGKKQANPDAVEGTIVTTNEEHQKNVKKQYKLKAKACELMDALKDGKSHDKKETAAKIGMKMNSTFFNLMTELKKLNVIVFDRATIQLHKDMLPFDDPSEE
jgi:hypothetical protein